MLFVLTGSSCSGKTTAARACDGDARLAVHDFDEAGVPSHADLVWRQRCLEAWIGRAVEYQSTGVDLLLTGQSPLGEILASPSAPRLNAIAVCLLDVDDEERLRRLEARDPGRWDGQAAQSLIEWARWHREHAADPRARPEAITAGGWEAMRWDRWITWTASDERWHTDVIDTTGRRPDAVAADVLRWVRTGRSDYAAGRRDPAILWGIRGPDR